MKTVKDVLDDTVREYNRTIFGNNSEFHKRDSYFERRGIFYNCMRRQFQYSIPTFKFSNKIDVRNLDVKFRVDGSVESFKVNKSQSVYNQEEENRILDEMGKYSGLEYLDTEARIDLDNIRNFQFKSIL